MAVSAAADKGLQPVFSRIGRQKDDEMKKLAIIIFAIFFLTFGMLALLADYRFIGLTKDTFGIKYHSSGTLFSFDTGRDFHGDGFSIDVEQLDSRSRDFFRNPPSDFFLKYPLRHAHLGDFRIFKWRKTPVAIEDTFRTNFGLKIDSPACEKYILNDDVGRYLYQAELRLNKPGNYYAICFEDHPYKAYGIDLYIVDPNDGLVFTINTQ